MTHGNDNTALPGIELGRIFAGKAHAPVVYFARIGDHVKIGTSTNLQGRMQSFYLPMEDVLVVVPGGKDVEAAYHARFAECRMPGPGRRELFRITGPLRSFLDPRRWCPDAPGPELPLMTLREACDGGVLKSSLAAARKSAQRPGFPKSAGWADDGMSAIYRTVELAEWQDGKVRVLR